MTKDKTARIILLLTNGKYDSDVIKLEIRCEEILESDLNIIYPIIKKLVSSVIEHSAYEPKAIIEGVKNCIKLLRNNGVLKKEIEKEISKTITIAKDEIELCNY